MPYKRRRRNSTRKTVTRAKYTSKTRRNNRSLILSNAKTLVRLDKLTRSHITSCDWCLGTSPETFHVPMLMVYNATLGGTDWSVLKLTDFATWNFVLRGNKDVEDENSTVVSYMKLNMRCNMDYTSEGGFLQVFLISPTKENPNFVPDLISIEDMTRVYQGSGPFMQGRFNPGAITVHKAWTKSLTTNTMVGPGSPNGPYTPNTWFTGKCYKKLGWKVTSPIDKSWKSIDFDELPYNKQMWLVAQVSTSPVDKNYVMDVQCYFNTRNSD